MDENKPGRECSPDDEEYVYNEEELSEDSYEYHLPDDDEDSNSVAASEGDTEWICLRREKTKSSLFFLFCQITKYI